MAVARIAARSGTPREAVVRSCLRRSVNIAPLHRAAGVAEEHLSSAVGIRRPPGVNGALVMAGGTRESIIVCISGSVARGCRVAGGKGTSLPMKFVRAVRSPVGICCSSRMAGVAGKCRNGPPCGLRTGAMAVGV